MPTNKGVAKENGGKHPGKDQAGNHGNTARLSFAASVQANNSLLICYIKSFPSSGGYYNNIIFLSLMLANFFFPANLSVVLWRHLQVGME